MVKKEEKVKKALKVTGVISIILGFISFCFLINNFMIFEHVRPLTLQFKKLGSDIDKLMIFVGIGFIFTFIFHISSILNLALQLKFFKSPNIVRAFSIFAGVLSILLLVGNLGLLSDIGKESQLGLNTSGEWIFLYVNHFLHAAFIMLMFGLIISSFQILKKNPPVESAVKDEVVFITAQYIGVFCGVLGFISLVSYLISGLPFWIVKKAVMPTSVIIVIPYCFIVFYWLIFKLKDKIVNWYDEKQFQDIAKASLTTLIISFPAMSLIYLSKYPDLTENYTTYFWFPFYLFLTLLTFSSSVLYFNRKG
jgi:hypothetical protein